MSDTEAYQRLMDAYIEAAAERDRLRAAAKELMPLLSECDCIYSDRNEPLCPCRSMRALLGYELVYCEECRSIALGRQPW